MKLLNIDWWQFFSSLELYREMPTETRAFFIEHVKPSSAVSQNLLLPWPSLVDSGLMAMGSTGVNANVKTEHREFTRAIRAIGRSQVLEAPSRETLHQYLDDNLTNSETAALGGSYLYGRTGFEGLQRLFSMVSSASWTKKFLSAKTDWERDFADPAQPRYFSSAEVLKAAQTMVRAIADQPEQPVLLHRLPELCSGMRPDVFSAAMRGVLRYLILFPALNGADLDPVIGLWPGVADKLANRPLPELTPVAVSQTFQAAFLLDDMVSMASACVAEPIRLRSGDLQIFEADRKGLADALGSLPEWVERTFRVDANTRISRAFDFLNDYGFVERFERPDHRLRVTDTGTAWLQMPVKQQLKVLLDGLRKSVKGDEQRPFGPRGPSLLPGISWSGSGRGGEKLIPAVLNAFATVPEGQFLRLADFLEHESRGRNALSEIMGGNRNFTLHIGGMYLSAPSEEEMEAAWTNFLASLLNHRLTALGGAQVAVEEGGNHICFSITSAGRYLLGAVNDFELPAEQEANILVQPNFEVVFLAASSRIEAEIARFSERKGRHIGTLFRITKGSIQAAAAAGLTAERVLEVLRENCPAGIPLNVASEITAWFRRYRQVKVRPATIIQCPDEETAAIVISVVGKKATRLSPTVLEVDDKKIQPAAAKKLKEAGIYVRSV